MASEHLPTEGDAARVIARVGKPHGLGGEVTVEVRTDDPQRRLRPGARFGTDPAQPPWLTLRSVRVHRGTHVLGFEGVTDRDAAERLRGLQLISGATKESPASEQTPTPGPEPDSEGYYEDELVGLSVVLPTGQEVGTASALHTRPAQDLLEVRLADGRTSLVPFVRALVPEVDPAARRIVVDPPPGLLDLGS